jgi:hypothetical protein
MMKHGLSIWRCTTATMLLATLPVEALAVPGGYDLVTTVGSDGKLEGCGARISQPGGAMLTITLHRQDMRSNAGTLELLATLPAIAEPVADIALTTTNAGEIRGFVIDDAQGPMPVHASANVEPDAAALLMHDVLLQGVTLSIGHDQATRIETAFDGPATPDVIRGYLQCAGNMGR